MARRSESAVRDKEIALEKLSTSKQQQGDSVQTVLQAKEIELTKAVDKLLQVSFKVKYYIFATLSVCPLLKIHNGSSTETIQL